MPLRPLLIAVLFLLGGLVLVPEAGAQEAGTDDARARALFIEGESHYAAGRYQEAADHYQKAFVLSQRPELLFNIGNAYERMGEYRKAADYLRRYADSPRARDVVSVRERIRRLEAAAEVEERRRAEAEAEAEAARKATTAAANESPAAEPSTRGDVSDPAIWWLAGSGGAAVVTVVFAVLSNAAGSDAEADCASTSGGVLLCDQDASDALSQETVFAIATDVSAVATVATLSVGLYLLLREDDGSAEAASALAPAVVPGGVGVSFSGRF